MEVTVYNTLYPWFASVLGWTVLYKFFCWYSPTRRPEWHCRVVTCIHAILIVCISGWCQFVQGPFVFEVAGVPSTPLQHKCAILSWSYFSYDLIWCLYHQTESPVMLLHHVVSNLGLGMSTLRGMYGTEMTATLFGTEITNPLLQLRWFLRETGNYHTWLGDINDILFMVLFGVVRLGVGSKLIYAYYQMDTGFVGRAAGTCIYAISWVFFYMIVKFAIRKYAKRFRLRKDKSAESENGNIPIPDGVGYSTAEVKKEQ